MQQPIFTKDELIEKLLNICKKGWIKSGRQGNAGGVGNTLEDLLGIKENNLPIPNAAEWELKCQRLGSAALTTLFHMEPSPTALRFVPAIFLPKYGWKHEKAGTLYPVTEMSFRQTISGLSHSDRGFIVQINFQEKKVMVSFNARYVGSHHSSWLASVEKRVGLGELNPQPYWGFEDLYHKAGTKLLNTFYVQAETKKIGGEEYFHYCNILKLTEFSMEGFLHGLEKGFMYIDFDARTGHNHGTKFRLRQDKLPELYKKIESLS